jgi:hypothetical protein
LLNPKFVALPPHPYVNPANIQYKKPENTISAFNFGQHKRQKFTNNLANHPIK